MLLPDHPTSLGTGCAVQAFGNDLAGRAVWDCTLWFCGAICHAVLTAPERPELNDLLTDVNQRPAAWRVLQSPAAKSA